MLEKQLQVARQNEKHVKPYDDQRAAAPRGLIFMQPYHTKGFRDSLSNFTQSQPQIRAIVSAILPRNTPHKFAHHA